jgi:SpoVK/Ycf46/Vps4 family AAA+-type ATPase
MAIESKGQLRARMAKRTEGSTGLAETERINRLLLVAREGVVAGRDLFVICT